MGFFKKLFGISESKQPYNLPQIPSSEWPGYLASLIEDTIAKSGLRDLPRMAAFVQKRNNGVALCIGRNGAMPDMTNDPDVLVYCYLQDVPAYVKIAETIRKILEATRR